MLEIISNSVLKPNNIYNIGSKYYYIFDKSCLYDSIFYKLKKFLITKEIDFENIFVEEKKNKDKNIIYTNFSVNHLLNFLNKKDQDLDVNYPIKHSIKNTQKKKIEKYKNIFLDNFFQMKKITTGKIKKHNNQILIDKKLLSNQFKKNKHLYNQKNEVNNNFHFIKSHNQYDNQKINFYNTIKDKTKNENNITFFTDLKNHKNSFFLSKKINVINNLLQSKNFIKNSDQSKNINLKNKSLFFCNSENSIKWKKSVSQKILLSISNKDNRAEINLKPEHLGSICIQIKMENNEANLNFFYNCKEVRTFLEDYTPFLRDSLKKNGITLRKVNISSFLKNKRIKNFENSFYKNSFVLNELQQKENIYKRNIENLKYQFIDVYV